MSNSEWSKECRCTNHTVPHWLWMDALDRERNRTHLARAVERRKAARPVDLSHLHAFAVLEHSRLRAKRLNMQRRGIAKIPQGILEQLGRDMAARDERVDGARRRRLEDLKAELRDVTSQHSLTDGSARAELAEKMNEIGCMIEEASR